MPSKAPLSTPPKRKNPNPNYKATLMPPWKKGQSGNPKGKPPTPQEFRDLARGYSTEALETVRKLAKNTKVSPNTRVRAAEVVINRGYGQPKETIEATVELNGSLDVALESLTDDQLAAIIAATGPEPKVSGTLTGTESPSTTLPESVHALGDSDSTSGSTDSGSDAPGADAGNPPADDT